MKLYKVKKKFWNYNSSVCIVADAFILLIESDFKETRKTRGANIKYIYAGKLQKSMLNLYEFQNHLKLVSQ